MGKKHQPPYYVAEEPATGLYLNLDGERARVVPQADASRYPATAAGRLDVCTRLAALCTPGTYEVVRVHP